MARNYLWIRCELFGTCASSFVALFDIQGGYDISPEGYSHMTHMLMSLANGNVILVLEVRIALQGFQKVYVFLGENKSQVLQNLVFKMNI